MLLVHAMDLHRLVLSYLQPIEHHEGKTKKRLPSVLRVLRGKNTTMHTNKKKIVNSSMLTDDSRDNDQSVGTFRFAGGAKVNIARVYLRP